MTIQSLMSAALTGLWLFCAQTSSVRAAELNVMCITPMEGAMKELGATFERETGHKLSMTFEVAPVLKRRIDAGAAFDVAILLAPLIEDLNKSGKLLHGTTAVVARSGMGVGVRAGAAKPDISTVAAFRETLRNAKSIAYSKEGASGVYFLKLIERLGIGDEIRGKLKATPAEEFARVVPSGEAEMIVVPVSAILAPGMDLVGPVPSELQNYFVFSAGVSAGARATDAAKALVDFLSSSRVSSVLRAKGMEPNAPR